MTLPRLPIFVIFSLAVAAPSAAQQLLRTHPSDAPFPGDGLGVAQAGIGDIDGDGIDDYALGASVRNQPGLPLAGAVRTYSGATGALLYEVPGTEENGLFGTPIEPAGDIDLDGTPDLLVGSWTPGFAPNAPPRVGTAFLVSGRTGAVVRTYVGTTPDGGFGAAIANLGDVDGDAVPDHAIGEPYSDGNGNFALDGVVHVHSGATGTRLYSVQTVGVERYGFGTSLRGVGDWTGDGLGDFAAWNEFDTATGNLLGEVTIRSGVDASIVHAFTGAPGARIRSSMDAGEDLDGDGFRDLLVARWQGTAVPTIGSSVTVLSGSDQTTLLEIAGPADDFWGTSAFLSSDADGDGVPDVVVQPAVQSFPDIILAEVYSGRTGALVVEVPKPATTAHAQPYAMAAAGDVNGDGFGDWLIPDFGFPATGGGCCVSGALVVSLVGRDGSSCSGPVNSSGAVARVAPAGEKPPPEL